MKKLVTLFIAFTVLLAFSSCQAKCDKCGEPIEGKSVEAAGRTYCDYNCYMEDFLGLK